MATDIKQYGDVILNNSEEKCQKFEVVSDEVTKVNNTECRVVNVYASIQGMDIDYRYHFFCTKTHAVQLLFWGAKGNLQEANKSVQLLVEGMVFGSDDPEK